MDLLTPEEIYDDWAECYEDGIRRMNWNAPDTLFGELSSYFTVTDSLKVFEAGIGTGFLAEKFKQEAGATISGADISSGMIDRLLSRGLLEPGHVVKLDLEKDDLPFADNYFDMAVSCGVLEYIEETSRSLDEMARVVREGGIIGLAYEADENQIDQTRTLAKSDSTGVDKNGNKKDGVFFYYHHSPARIKAQFETAGVRQIKAYRFDSVETGYEPIRYNLFIGQKLPCSR